MIVPSPKQTNLLVVLSVIGLMGYGLYSQYVMGLEPCPLCMTQRAFYCLIGAMAFIALLHSSGHKIYAGFMSLWAIGGIAAAGRMVWLQHLPPDQVPACGPSLQYMLETFPISETLQTLVTGDGNCAEVVWQLLGFSMPEWALLWFVFFLLVGGWQLLRKS